MNRASGGARAVCWRRTEAAPAFAARAGGLVRAESSELSVNGWSGAPAPWSRCCSCPSPVSFQQFPFCLLFVCLSKENKMLSLSTYDADLGAGSWLHGRPRGLGPRGQGGGCPAATETRSPAPQGRGGRSGVSVARPGGGGGVHRGTWRPSS